MIKPDGTVVDEVKELVITRTEGIAHIGSAAMTNHWVDLILDHGCKPGIQLPDEVLRE